MYVSRFAWLLALCALLGACSQTPKAQTGNAETQAVRTAIDTQCQEFADRYRLPGFAIGTVQTGKPAWSGAFAYDRTQFASFAGVGRIGSVTKVITAQAVLKLRDQGKLSLDDAVAKFVPEAANVLSAPGRKPVLVRHLLQHTSGIPTLGDGTLDWTQGPRITQAALLSSVADCTLSFEPGTAFEYSNVGMALAGVVVSRASGMTARDYITTSLLAPLGMEKTMWDESRSSVTAGYERRPGRWVQAKPYWDLGAIEPAGGLYSTVQDMLRFVAFQFRPERNPGVLSADSVRQSHQPGPHGCGLGWMVGSDARLGTIVWHNGSTHAHGAWVGFAPEKLIGVVVLLSTGDLEVVDAAARLGINTMRLASGFEPIPEPPPTAPTPPTPAAVVDTVVERLRGLLADPENIDLKGVFAQEFIDEFDERTLRYAFESFSESLGAIERHEVIRDEGQGEFTLALHGASRTRKFSIVAGMTPPHLIEGLYSG